MCSSRRALACPRAGFPIRIPPACRGCTPLAGAFRRVPRPSSARHAKAFPVCLSSFSISPLVTETSVFARFLLPYVVVNVPWSLVLTSSPGLPAGEARQTCACPSSPLDNPIEQNGPTSCRAANLTRLPLCQYYSYSVRGAFLSVFTKQSPSEMAILVISCGKIIYRNQGVCQELISGGKSLTSRICCVALPNIPTVRHFNYI